MIYRSKPLIVDLPTGSGIDTSETACCSDTIQRHSKPVVHLVMGALACLVGGAGYAQENLGASIKLGETDLYPEVRIEYVQNDNALRQAESGAFDASQLIISPTVNWIAERSQLQIRATYLGEYAKSSIGNPPATADQLVRNFDESDLDFADHALRASVVANVSKRLRLDGSVGYRQGHDDPGTNFSSSDVAADVRQVTFDDVNLGGRVTYGVKNARGNVAAGFNIRQYSPTNLAPGDNTSSDYVLFRPFGVFSFRVSADTRWVTELRLTNVDNEITSRDRSEIGILTGLSLAQTRKLSGLIQIGATDISRENGTNDSTEMIAEGELVFRPNDFSRFNFNVRREVDNIGEGFFTSSQPDVLTTRVGLGWRHTFSSRVYHQANIQQTLRDRDCPGQDSDVFDASYELNVLPERWFEVGAKVGFDSREFADCPAGSDGTIPVAGDDYERTEVGVHIRVTL